jgi:hypothetical protein
MNETRLKIDIEFRDALGRTVSSGEWVDCVKREAIQEGLARARTTIYRVRCPIHARRPRNIRGADDRLTWQPCCARHESAIAAALECSPGPDAVAPVIRSRPPSGARSAG